jgi:hypothetical protein
MIDERQDLRRGSPDAAITDEPDDQRQHRGIGIGQPRDQPLVHAVCGHRGDGLPDRRDDGGIGSGGNP